MSFGDFGGAKLKLEVDEQKFFILRMIDGVRHKIWRDKQGVEHCDLFPETEEERERKN